MRNIGSRNAARAHAAFTLVELLVVMGVLFLLVSILLPSLQSVRVRAKETRTWNLLKVVETGLESFFTDRVVGGDEYPVSKWDSGKGDPYGETGKQYYGAQTLVWAIAGADLLGTPGCSDNDDLSSSGGLYTMSGDDPAHYRSGPYIDVSKATIKAHGSLDPLHQVKDDKTSDKSYVILDDFSMPLLYYRADMTKSGYARYDRNDNIGFVADGYAGQATHVLEDQGTATDAGTGFLAFIRNPIITAGRPHNYDSYLLVAAGKDERYGTADDITNFPLVGGKNYK